MIREIFLTALCRRGIEAHGLREIQAVKHLIWIEHNRKL